LKFPTAHLSITPQQLPGLPDEQRSPSRAAVRAPIDAVPLREIARAMIPSRS